MACQEAEVKGGGEGVYNNFFVCKVHQLHFPLGQISSMFLKIKALI